MGSLSTRKRKSRVQTSAWSRLKALHGIRPGGSPGRRSWTPEADRSRTLSCRDCAGVHLIIRQERMAHQDSRKRASHTRLVAYCPRCKAAWRLRVGGPR
jgi:hypothetical protein